MWLFFLLALATAASAQTVPICAQGTSFLCTTDTSVTKAGSCIGDLPGDFCGSVFLTSSVVSGNSCTWTGSVTTPIVNGSTSGGGSLTLKSTTAGTKGPINFGAAATTFYDETNNNWTLAGKVAKYNNVATVSAGMPSIVAEVNLTAQGANIAGVTMYTPPVAGFFRVNITIAVTRAGTTSTMPSTGLAFTDGDNAALELPTMTATSTANSLTTQASVTYNFYAAASAIQYTTSGYASTGATTMQYRLRIRLEAL